MAINWVKVRNEYVNGNISQRKLAAKYNVSFQALNAVSVKENWVDKRKEQREKTRTKVEQKTAESIAVKEASRMVRISGLNDRLLDAIEKAMNELNIAVVHGKKQKKKSKNDTDGSRSEILEVEESVDTASSIIDVNRVRQLTAALRDIAEVSSMTNGYTKHEEEETDIVKALREAYKARER